MPYSPSIHINNYNDILNLRKTINNYLWGNDNITIRKADVITQNTQPPLSGLNNLLRCDSLTIQMEGGFVSICKVLHPVISKDRLIVVHQGHASGFSIAGVNDTIKAFLQQGFTVACLEMPLYGSNTGPISLPHENFANYDYIPELRIFIEPTIIVLNTLLPGPFIDVSMVGVSGGGWTTTLVAAIDERIKYSFPVAGSYPLPLWTWAGDWEQYNGHGPFYTTITYEDLYIMGSCGIGRKQLQCLNFSDTCCFYGEGWKQYQPTISSIVNSIGGNFSVFQYNKQTHAITPECLQKIMENLGMIIKTIDNDQPGFSKTGAWTTWNVTGWPTNIFQSASPWDGVATWEFTDLPQGVYSVAAAWPVHTNRTQQAPYKIYDGEELKATIYVNQEIAGTDINEGGKGFKILTNLQCKNGKIKVVLNAVNGSSGTDYVEVDAIRIEKIGEIPPDVKSMNQLIQEVSASTERDLILNIVAARNIQLNPTLVVDNGGTLDGRLQ